MDAKLIVIESRNKSLLGRWTKIKGWDKLDDVDLECAIRTAADRVIRRAYAGFEVALRGCTLDGTGDLVFDVGVRSKCAMWEGTGETITFGLEMIK